jgi:SAM-dependent methyltransferase
VKCGATRTWTNTSRLTGVDASESALAIAQRRYLVTLPDGSRFRRGDFSSTPLPDRFAYGVMRTDALPFAPDLSAAFRELARILKSGCRLAFTGSELRAHSATLSTGPILDYRPALEKAGFSVQLYLQTPSRESRMRAVFSGILERKDRLVQELGEPAGPITFAWATLRPGAWGQSARNRRCAVQVASAAPKAAEAAGWSVVA